MGCVCSIRSSRRQRPDERCWLRSKAQMSYQHVAGGLGLVGKIDPTGAASSLGGNSPA